MSSQKKRQVSRETKAKNLIRSADSAADSVVETMALVPTETNVGLVSKKLDNVSIDNVFRAKLTEKGMTEDQVAEWLYELCNWKTTRIDKNGNITEYTDGGLRLKAIEIYLKLTGNLNKETGGTVHNHLHLVGKMSDDELNGLFGKTR